MVKIIINGESHNSIHAPLLAVRDIDALVAAGKVVVCATEDPGSAKEILAPKTADREGFVKNIKQMAMARSLLRERKPDLFAKISSGNIDLSPEELEPLAALLEETGLNEDIEFPEELANCIAGFEADLAPLGGYERLVNHERYLDRLVDETSPIAVLVIEDREAVGEIHHLQKIMCERGLSAWQKERLDTLIKDVGIEDRRTSTMADKLFAQARALPKNGVIYVYPIGNSHVHAVASKLTGKAIEAGLPLEIHASCTWDSREEMSRLLTAFGEALPPGRNIFLSEPGHGGYDALFAGIFPEVILPALAAPGTAVAAAGGAAAGAGGGRDAGGRA